MNEILIRKLNSADAKDFYNVRLMGLRQYPEAFGMGADFFAKATNEQLVARLSQPEGEGFVLGAFENTTLIGLIGFTREPKFAVHHKATVWGLFVKSEYQNKGIGKNLVKRLIEMSRLINDVEYLRALVTVTSMSALKILESVGFEKYGIEVNGVKINDKYYDQNFLKLNLR